MGKIIETVGLRFAIGAVLIAALFIAVYVYGAGVFAIAFVLLFLLIVPKNLEDLRTNGEARMKKFARMKETGQYSVDSELELAPGEEITCSISPAFVRMTGLAGYSTMPRDIIITNRRVAVGFDVLGAREVFGEMNLWQPSLKKIPKMKKKYSEILSPLGEIMVKEAVMSKDGKAALITASQAGISILIEIFHPKAKEIVELLGK